MRVCVCVCVCVCGVCVHACVCACSVCVTHCSIHLGCDGLCFVMSPPLPKQCAGNWEGVNGYRCLLDLLWLRPTTQYAYT